MDSYEKKYKDALARMELCIRTGLKITPEYIFPELKESEDEKIRKEIVRFIQMEVEDEIVGNKWLAWLQKQVEQKSLYIRFGDIPNNEKSKIYRGEEEIGEENGVSVYPAFESNGDIVIGLTLPITRTSLHTQQHLLEYDNRPCYLVSGDCVGKGTDGEPLIRNICIIKQLNNYRIKEIDKQGEQKPFDYENANIQQNPAWSEEDEKIFRSLSGDLARISANTRTDSTSINYSFFAEIEWLRSLKERVGCEVNCTTQKEWSEEDEYNFAFIQEALLGLDGDDSYREKCCKMAEWLESLKEKFVDFDKGFNVGFSAAKYNQWKPSDKQMKLLKDACDQHWEPDGLDPLYTLYQDLMKLKG